MSKMSNYLENALLNATLRNIPYTPPTQIYLALFTSDPTDNGTGAEVGGGSYARQSITFSAPNNGTVSNNNEVIFPIATTNWGSITHCGVMDSLTSGNLMYYGALSITKTVSIGDQFKVNIGNLSISLD